MNPTIPANQISFNSAFQNGNLDCVIKVAPTEYDLFLRIDSNTRGHTNWYFFSINNKKNVNVPIRLNICNLSRSPGLYDQGFRPFVFSKRENQQKGSQWQQRGQQIILQATSLRYQLLGSKGDNFFRLSFNYTFQFDDDQVQFAYCVPYTYSDMNKDLHLWQKQNTVRRSVLGRSLSGLQLPILHISNHQKGGYCGGPKKNIVVIGRAHPAETCGSYVLRGFINWLIGDSPEAAQVRQKTNIFIVPMLNPDGVVLGNSRTSAAGKDLNRQFLNVRRDLYPQVYLTKTLIARLQRRYGLLLFLDFHGHSRRKNTFFYGPAYPISHREYYKCRALPKIIQKINPCFRFYSCSFMISQSKRTTARAVALSQIRVPYVFTVESSVGLFYNPQTMKTNPFTVQTWQQMGANIAQGVSTFVVGLQQLEYISKQRKIQRQKQKEIKIKGKDVFFQEKDKKRSFLLDLLDEVKIAVSKGNFDEDVESDDHQSKQDLESYQLSQFNNLVVSGRQRQRKFQNKIVQQQEQNFQIFASNNDDIQQMKINQEISKPILQRSSRSQMKSNWPKISSTIYINESRKSLFNKQRNITPHIQKQQKNTPIQNKNRITLTSRNYFPEDRCQIVSLPKNIRKKRQKPVNIEFISQLINRKGLNSLVDKMGIARSNSNFMEISEPYRYLNGLELDNRAMTITTFRKK